MQLRISAGLLLLMSAVTVSASSNSTFHPRMAKQSVPHHESFSKRAITQTEYDYIVVGGGTTGMTLASRLSEDPSVTVLVLEAGIDYTDSLVNQQFVQTPGADVLGCGSDVGDNAQSVIDYETVTVPQDGANGRRIRYASGKCLGGSSARNFMLYQRPPVAAQDSWVALTGDSQWSWANTLNDYKKSGKVTAPRAELRKDNPPAKYNPGSFSPAGGPLEIGFPNYAQPFSGPLQQSLAQIGVPTINDQNGGNIIGAQYATLTVEAGSGRRSTSRAFYLAAKDRPNFTLVSRARAQKLTFDTSGRKPRATGVTFEDGNGLFGLGIVKQTVTVKARKEVIVSAGTLRTPQLLMASGIGPKAQLAKYNIPLIVDSPNVGQNLEDHVFFGPTYPVKVETLTKIAANPLYLAAQFTTFFATNRGPLTNNVADMIAFERFSDAKLDAIGAGVLKSYPAGWPTHEYLSAPGYVGNFANLIASNAPIGLLGQQYATILMAVIAPRSRGTVGISSANTADQPVFDPRWMTDPVDQKVAVEMFKRARDAFGAAAMKPILDGPEYFPGTKVTSDADILNFVRNNLMTVWHVSCSARMGKNIATAVLDSNLRVFGVDGLRVADASAFPSLLPGHPQSVLYMMAERAAKLILASK